jgi:hypothetical protein
MLGSVVGDAVDLELVERAEVFGQGLVYRVGIRSQAFGLLARDNLLCVNTCDQMRCITWLKPLLRSEVEGKEETLTEEEALEIIEKCIKVMLYRDAQSLDKVWPSNCCPL